MPSKWQQLGHEGLMLEHEEHTAERPCKNRQVHAKTDEQFPHMRTRLFLQNIADWREVGVLRVSAGLTDSVR